MEIILSSSITRGRNVCILYQHLEHPIHSTTVSVDWLPVCKGHFTPITNGMCFLRVCHQVSASPYIRRSQCAYRNRMITLELPDYMSNVISVSLRLNIVISYWVPCRELVAESGGRRRLQGTGNKHAISDKPVLKHTCTSYLNNTGNESCL